MMALWDRVVSQIFSPKQAEAPAATHAACVSAREYAALQDRVREMESQLQTYRMQVMGAEDRLKNIEARAQSYGRMYALLQKAAFPVSFLLTEGSVEEAMAINARLWDLVREDAQEA